MTVTWQEISIFVGFLILYTKIVFDYSRIKSELQTNSIFLKKIEILLTKHDDKIDSLDKRVLKLETINGIE